MWHVCGSLAYAHIHAEPEEDILCPALLFHPVPSSFSLNLELG